jgi:predicted  nucleic acid-binding Zn-ribbon protein
MVHICDYCGQLFNNRSNLTRHQKQSSRCLKSQGRASTGFVCQECGKSYTRNDSLQRHQKKCGGGSGDAVSDAVGGDEALVRIVEKYGDMVRDLQRQVSELSTGNSSNSRNVVMNNLQPITETDLQDYLEHLTLNYIQEGAKGYANFAGNYPFKDKVMCTDRSRKKIQYKNEDGDLTDDGRVLAQRFFTAISEKNTEILNSAYEDLHRQIKEIISSGRAGDSDISGIMMRATVLQDILIKSQRAAEGKDDKFTKEFLSHLTNII